jgi:hypothetical protein
VSFSLKAERLDLSGRAPTIFEKLQKRCFFGRLHRNYS